MTITERFREELQTARTPYFDLKVRSLLLLLMLEIFRKEPLAGREKGRDNTSMENYKNLLGVDRREMQLHHFRGRRRLHGAVQALFFPFF